MVRDKAVALMGRCEVSGLEERCPCVGVSTYDLWRLRKVTRLRSFQRIAGLGVVRGNHKTVRIRSRNWNVMGRKSPASKGRLGKKVIAVEGGCMRHLRGVKVCMGSVPGGV